MTLKISQNWTKFSTCTLIPSFTFIRYPRVLITLGHVANKECNFISKLSRAVGTAKFQNLSSCAVGENENLFDLCFCECSKSSINVYEKIWVLLPKIINKCIFCVSLYLPCVYCVTTPQFQPKNQTFIEWENKISEILISE